MMVVTWTTALLLALGAETAAEPPPPPGFNTTMWVLPSGCMKVSVNGQALYQCEPNWLKQLQSDKGPYYAVVAPPQ